MNRFGILLAVVWTVFASFGCMAVKKMKVGMATNPYPNDPESIVRGKTIYQTHCARCHGAEGRGDGPGAVGLIFRPLDLTNYASEKSANTAAMNISYGKNEMPPYVELLTTQEIWDVSNYVISLGSSTPSQN